MMRAVPNWAGLVSEDPQHRALGLITVTRHVLPADRGQAECAVLGWVLVANGAEETEINETDRGRQDLSLDSPRPSRWLRMWPAAWGQGSMAAVVTRLLDLSEPGVVYPRLPRLTGSYSQSLRLKAT